MYYDRQSLSDAAVGLEALAQDTTKAWDSIKPGLQTVDDSDGGLVYNQLLKAHSSHSQSLSETLGAAGRLLNNAASHVEDTRNAYDGNEGSNIEDIASLWQALEHSPDIEPIGPPPEGGVQANPDWAEKPLGQEYPGFPYDNIVFDILGWADYISVVGFIRKMLSNFCQWALGWDDPCQWAFHQIGGDWNRIHEASFHWGRASHFFRDLAPELEARVQVMFQGWFDSEAASAAGAYFGVAVDALGSAQTPWASLESMYAEMAESTYWWCQAAWSAFDAIIDALIAMALTGVTFAEALASIATFGATAPLTVLTAIFTFVEVIAAAVGMMMAAVGVIAGLANTIKAFNHDIEHVSLPEG